MPGKHYVFNNNKLKFYEENPDQIYKYCDNWHQNYSIKDIFHILRLNLVDNLPKCSFCSKETHHKYGDVFNRFCSNSCQSNGVIRKSFKKKSVKKQKIIISQSEKYKQTCLERYGVDNPSKLDNVKEKIKQTCLERYGVDNPSKLDNVKEQVKNTTIKNNGGFTLESDKLIEKYKQTCLERYGVDNPLKNIEIRNKGIQLLQFWDIEIENKWDIIKNILLSKLGIYFQRVDARKCKIVDISNEQERQFLNENHLQEYIASSICYGLEYQNELISLMTFIKSRYSKKYDWELLRFCSKINTQVIGGASKLFCRKPEGSIISYADRRYSQGNLYKQLKLNQQLVSNPNYFYTKDYQTLESRLKYQKHKLLNILESFNPDLTEWENMKANGFDRIWDCGNSVWIL